MRSGQLSEPYPAPPGTQALEAPSKREESPVQRRAPASVQRSRVWCLPVVFGAAALAVLCGSLLGPWYSYNLRDGPDSHGVTFVTTTDQNLFGERRYESEYDRESFRDWSDFSDDENIPRLFSHLLSLVIIGTALAVGAVVGCALSLRGGRRGVAIAIALVLTAWCFFMPVFFMMNLEPARDADVPGGDGVESFWGQSDSPDAEIGAPGNIHHRISTWGPDVGWYLSVLAGVLGALTLLALVLTAQRPRFTGLRVPVAMALVAMLCLVGSAVALYPGPVPQEPPGGDGLGCRVEALEGGDWIIYITSGYARTSGLDIMIVNSSTGSALVDARVSSGTAGNPDFILNDSNQNNRLDPGDSILLKGMVNGRPNPNVQAGFKVQFLRNDNIIGTIKELPPH